MERKPFEQVVVEHGPTVLRVCRAVLGPVDADDAWSETFLSALRAYPQLPPGSNLQAWLVTIASRKAIDQHRSRARRPVPSDRLTATGGPTPAQPTAPTPAERDDDLWAALEALTYKQRAAVAYHHIGGLPYAEVAQLLGSTETAARRAASDGIRRLRAELLPQPHCR